MEETNNVVLKPRTIHAFEMAHCSALLYLGLISRFHDGSIVYTHTHTHTHTQRERERERERERLKIKQLTHTKEINRAQS